MSMTTIARALIGMLAIGGAGAAVADAQRPAPTSAPAPVAVQGVVWADDGPSAAHASWTLARPCPLVGPVQPAATVAPEPGSVVITFTVPEHSVLTVDGSGRVLSATTNTGCAPRPTDELWLSWPSGVRAPAGADVLDGATWLASSADPARFLPIDEGSGPS